MGTNSISLSEISVHLIENISIEFFDFFENHSILIFLRPCEAHFLRINIISSNPKETNCELTDFLNKMTIQHNRIGKRQWSLLP